MDDENEHCEVLKSKYIHKFIVLEFFYIEKI